MSATAKPRRFSHGGDADTNATAGNKYINKRELVNKIRASAAFRTRHSEKDGSHTLDENSEKDLNNSTNVPSSNGPQSPLSANADSGQPISLVLSAPEAHRAKTQAKNTTKSENESRFILTAKRFNQLEIADSGSLRHKTVSPNTGSSYRDSTGNYASKSKRPGLDATGLLDKSASTEKTTAINESTR